LREGNVALITGSRVSWSLGSVVRDTSRSLILSTSWETYRGFQHASRVRGDHSAVRGSLVAPGLWVAQMFPPASPLQLGLAPAL